MPLPIMTDKKPDNFSVFLQPHDDFYYIHFSKELKQLFLKRINFYKRYRICPKNHS
ncbi:hypothetical protein DhcVS_1022 [Dehalococcoides mccartyi VS]|uniref:Uncharacterized protein n=1 Tax=Dehalococcoides mccartyi (strain VS) TaxID=311424 RepID=D2BII9_DEHMV|nr:hypothetical protein DhcVS_1022 [Dehalococcoides mccartyi VS]